MRSTPPVAEPGARAGAIGAVRAFARSVAMGATAGFAAPIVLLGRCGFYLFVVVIYAAFWGKVAAERVPGGLAHALPAGGLVLYVAVTEWVIFSTPAVHLKLEDDIRSGLVEGRLLRPKSHLLLRLGDGLGGLVARMAALSFVATALFVLLGLKGMTPAILPGVFILGLAGAVVGLLNLALVGLSAFWLRRTLPVYLVNQKASFLLGGLLAPVTLYPAWLAKIAIATPYAAQFYWPAALVIDPRPIVFRHALEAQAAWAVLLGLALAGVWTLGIRKLLRDGGV